MNILMYFLIGQLHAQAPCAASCALLQWGRATYREIRDEAKVTGFDTILIKLLGPIRAADLNEAQNECTDRAQRYTWWKPTGEIVQAVLFDDLQVRRIGDVNIVEAWTRQTACR